VVDFTLGVPGDTVGTAVLGVVATDGLHTESGFS
jgi:hypothetical protein